LKTFLIIYITFLFLDILNALHPSDFYDQGDAGYSYEHIYYSLSLIQNFILCFFGLKQNAIYSEIKNISKEDIKDEFIDYNKKDLSSKEKPFNHDIDTKKIYLELFDYIKKEKLYKNPELSLFYIAKKIEINRTYLTISIKEETKDNFYTFINKLRVEESKKLLLSDTFKKHTIDTIAIESGFKSIPTFYSWFKKLTGKTPLEFKKDNI